jgi:hypothetical protein
MAPSEIFQIGKLILVIDVEKNDAVIGNFFAVPALVFQAPVFLSAHFAPIVDKPIIPPADILLEPPVMGTVHATVGIIGMKQQPLDNPHYSRMSGRVGFLDFLEFGGK